MKHTALPMTTNYPLGKEGKRGLVIRHSCVLGQEREKHLWKVRCTERASNRTRARCLQAGCTCAREIEDLRASVRQRLTQLCALGRRRESSCYEFMKIDAAGVRSVRAPQRLDEFRPKHIRVDL